ncbi:MAG: 50S ribosomal protein L24 [Bacteroidota bacterium]|nr:50S ribosomal protein L24 [Bacteroidota bacterium]
MAKLHIKKGDKVKVIAGNSKGKLSTVLSVITDTNKVVVEGVNMVTKHQKPTSTNPNGTIIKREAPLHISNVMLVEESTGQVTRVGRRLSKDGKSERYSLKSGKAI